MERVDEVVGPLVKGRRYLVPTVKAEWLDSHGIADWPVIGPRHKDPDLGANVSHYHIDLRFIPISEFKRDTNSIVNESCGQPIRYEEWVCLEPCVIMRVTNSEGAIDLNRTWRGRKCGGSKKTGWICPHQGLYLGSQPAVLGVITCPGHGMRIDAESGRVLPK